MSSACSVTKTTTDFEKNRTYKVKQKSIFSPKISDFMAKITASYPWSVLGRRIQA